MENVKIAVLGLGRMGSAMVERLGAQGHSVTGWSRRAQASHSANTTTTDAAAAVAGAQVVLLALFDGTACREVLDRTLEHLPESCVVINTATVSPAEAVEFEESVRRAGRAYVHCPVMGSVPAVLAGSLTLLVGAEEATAPADTVLSDLGAVVRCGDAATSAALKLVANGVLADGLVTVGSALARAERLGLDREQLLDVLARTMVGGFVTAKRADLEGASGPATFTAGALRKDVRMLATIDPASRRLQRIVDQSQAADDQDIAEISVDLGRPTRLVDASSNLYAEAGTAVDDSLLRPLISYARGHATADPGHFRAAFRPGAHVEGLRGGDFVSWDLTEYCTNFDGVPAEDEAARVRVVTDLVTYGSVGHATMRLVHGDATFTDVFLLVCEGGDWRIANKVYHRD